MHIHADIHVHTHPRSHIQHRALKVKLTTRRIKTLFPFIHTHTFIRSFIIIDESIHSLVRWFMSCWLISRCSPFFLFYPWIPCRATHAHAFLSQYPCLHVLARAGLAVIHSSSCAGQSFYHVSFNISANFRRPWTRTWTVLASCLCLVSLTINDPPCAFDSDEPHSWDIFREGRSITYPRWSFQQIEL